MKFHHVGIPSATKREGEVYLEAAKLYVTDAEASPYRIEWLRFEDGSGMPEQLKTGAHVAFEVDDLQAAMAGKTVLIEPFSPMEGVEVAFITDGEAVIELMRKEK